jgi:hypothetical protein
MKFDEIVSRLTGISVPIFGISWNPPETERKIARRVIAFLENRRVLYAPFDYEVPGHCIQSVIEMRHFLTTELQALDSDKEIAQSLRAMRAACRKFLDDDPWHGSPRGYPSPRMLESALGELRGVFGIHIARLAAQNGLDVEDDLAVILPAKDEDEPTHGGSRHRPPTRRPSHDDE